MESLISDTAQLRRVKRLIDEAMAASRTLPLPELEWLLGAAALAISDELAARPGLSRTQPGNQRKAPGQGGKLLAK